MKCCYCEGDIPINAMPIHLTECEVLQQRLRAAEKPSKEISDTDRLNWLLSHVGAEVGCRDNQSDVFYVKTTRESIDKQMEEEQLIEEETYRESLRLRREREECSKNWRPVDASTAVQLANLFSSGVSWAGSSKGDIVAGMQPSTTSDWEGFKEAMDYAAKKTLALKKEVYQDVRANAQKIKERRHVNPQ